MMENRWYLSMFTKNTAVTRQSWIGLWIYRGRRRDILDQGFVGLWFSRGQNVGLGTSFYKITSNTRLGAKKVGSQQCVWVRSHPKGSPMGAPLRWWTLVGVFSLESRRQGWECIINDYSCRIPSTWWTGIDPANTSCVLLSKFVAPQFREYQLYCYM